MPKSLTIAAAACIVVSVCAPAAAAVVVTTYTGTADYRNSGGVHLQTRFLARFTLDTDKPGFVVDNPDPAVQVWSGEWIATQAPVITELYFDFAPSENVLPFFGSASNPATVLRINAGVADAGAGQPGFEFDQIVHAYYHEANYVPTPLVFRNNLEIYASVPGLIESPANLLQSYAYDFIGIDDGGFTRGRWNQTIAALGGSGGVAELTYSADLFLERVTQTVTGLPTGVPEPSTWATMILGFGAAGAALRRRSPRLAA